MAPREFSFTGIAKLLALISVLPVVYSQQDQLPLSGESSKRPVHPSRDAQVNIYTQNRCTRERGQLVTELDIPVNTCASANFTLDNNVHLQYPGLCSGGVKFPYIAIYPSADCTGDHAHPDWYDRKFSYVGAGHCLSKAVWGNKELEISENQWSVMFRCDGDDQAVSPKDTIKLSLPQPPPKAEKPKAPRPSSASVSDSACWIPSLGMDGSPKFIFQRPEADTCVDMAPEHKLKIYRNALCVNGTEALFAKFSGKGCQGMPVELKEVDESLIATNSPNSCIEMGGKDASSYAFWCTGNLQSKKVAEGLFPDEGDDYIRIDYTYGNPSRSGSAKSGATTNRATGLFGAVAVLFSFLGLHYLF